MDRARIGKLRPRERECLRLAGQGFTSKEIAASLGIAPNTVDEYVKHAVSVLGVSSRREAARLLAELEAVPQELEYQPEQLAAAAEPAPSNPPERIGPALLALLPIRQRGKKTNDLNMARRLAWIVGAAILILVGLSMLANTMDTAQAILRGRP